MKKILAIIVLSSVPLITLGAGGNEHLMHVKVDLGDRASLQRGARLFVNYCLSCHSASFMRYNRIGHDLGLTDEQVIDNLMFASDKVGETMQVAMQAEDAVGWLDAAPPDLSVVSRSRGVDWLYSYLMSFYQDDDKSRPTGVNNLVFQGTAMPHVLGELQGVQIPVYKEVETDDGNTVREIEGLELKEQGTMNPVQYKRAVSDLVNFLAYVGEPAQLHRYYIGTWVLLFLAGFFVLTYLLYKEYWKDVH